MKDDTTGGVFKQWHSKILPNYTIILTSLIHTINKLPRSAFFITEQDVRDLRMLCYAFDVEMDGTVNLKNADNFYMLLGLLKKKAKEAAEKELRPGNPLDDEIKKLIAEDDDLVIEDDEGS